MRKAKKTHADEIKVLRTVDYMDKIQLDYEWGLKDMPDGYYVHVSLSRKNRLPTWEDVKKIKEEQFGDTSVFMVLPTEDKYVNIHNYCFHLFQYKGKEA